ncbi:tubulin binding cofactor A [Fragilariopsis cylindrus CCMP1102]|uniref:Tubulin-specific chaperone A n=1 Tax=Fragilariopsis cylindrus CCMP1102 TaxID=635003 RepID=A0A1E7FE22_9STRA|nr:tubulin binding cofactor A [Fragilariopsis cylindrus CCMP1102]|eukprot:OEU16399.1 tubulin binding cofactor A [Fragilariopsis cylindrus CCMP1102]
MKKRSLPDPQRQLMIKTKACQRLSKEVSYYQDEVDENEEKIKEMKDQNRNPYDIKKFQEVLGESYMMIPDSKNRLEQALSDLTTYVESAEVKGLETNEWYVQAQELLKKDNCQTGDISTDIVEETDVSGLQEGEAF